MTQTIQKGIAALGKLQCCGKAVVEGFNHYPIARLALSVLTLIVYLPALGVWQHAVNM